MASLKYKFLARDLRRNRAVNLTLALFILLSALLMSSSLGIVSTLLGSLDDFFAKAGTPDFIQMHIGELDQAELDAFSRDNPLVLAQMTEEMLNIQGSSIYLGNGMGNSGESEAASVTDISLVTQNPDFDFLLDLNNAVALVGDGQIGVPVFFMQSNDLKIGDRVRIEEGCFVKELEISVFIRDSQMNPSLVNSKRLLVSPADWAEIREHLGQSEYLISFLSVDPALAGDLEREYLGAGLPQNGTGVTQQLFKLLSGLSDGLVAAVIILIALLLIAIALLCLRYVLLAGFEEDVREIGVMKAIGLSEPDIRSFYLGKYLVLAAAACGLGFLLSLPLGGIFRANITLYMGSSGWSLGSVLWPLLGALFIFLLVTLFARLVLRGFRKISPVQALRAGAGATRWRNSGFWAVHKSKFPNLNIFLGLRDVFGRFGSYLILVVVFAVGIFLAVLPTNFLNTIRSPDFLTYMGLGRCELRLDLQRAGNMLERYEQLVAHLAADPDIAKSAVMLTGSFKVLHPDGSVSGLNLESGDFSVFPLKYLEGCAPMSASEIALSSMNAEELGKQVGDGLTLLVQDEPRQLTVCGIYQDLTNGGKTAKGLLPVDAANALWYVGSIDLVPGVDAAAKKLEYARLFSPARVLDTSEYVAQNLGAVIGQLKLAAVAAVLIALAVSVLITAMFFRLTLAKEKGQIAIMKSLGFTPGDLRVQYTVRTMTVLAIGLLAGSLLSGWLGQGLIGLFMSGLGAAQVKLLINPWFSYLLCPLLLAGAASLTVLAVSSIINKTDSLSLAAE